MVRAVRVEDRDEALELIQDDLAVHHNEALNAIDLREG